MVLNFCFCSGNKWNIFQSRKKTRTCCKQFFLKCFLPESNFLPSFKLKRFLRINYFANSIFTRYKNPDVYCRFNIFPLFIRVWCYVIFANLQTNEKCFGNFLSGSHWFDYNGLIQLRKECVPLLKGNRNFFTERIEK